MKRPTLSLSAISLTPCQNHDHVRLTAPLHIWAPDLLAELEALQERRLARAWKDRLAPRQAPCQR